MLCKYFPPNLTKITVLYPDVLNFYITLTWIICNKLSDDWISTQ